MFSIDKSSGLIKWFFALVVLAAFGTPPACGQTEISEVHVQPRVLANPPQILTSKSQGTIRKRVDLVLVPVTITDTMDHAIAGLDQSNFRVFEGKHPQEIKHFSSEDAPVSIGIILDMSGSMKAKLERAREAVLELCRTANTEDEFFLIAFSDAPKMVQEFTQRVEDIQEKLLFVQPKGSTALLDAIYMGVDTMKMAKYQRRALVVISDGGDNHSRYTATEVKSLVKEADVLIYSVAIVDRYALTREEVLGPELLNEVSEVTGAQSFTLENPKYLAAITHKIGTYLRHQYVLAYRPDTSQDDGKWRKIKVKMTLLPKGLPQLLVHAKTGYYAPTQ